MGRLEAGAKEAAGHSTRLVVTGPGLGVWLGSWPPEEQERTLAAGGQVTVEWTLSCISFHHPTVNKEGRSGQGARVPSEQRAMPTGDTVLDT